MFRFAIAATSALTVVMAAAAAVPEAPSLKPPVTHASKVVSTKDAEIIRDALRAADRGQWGTVAQLQRQAGSSIAGDLILWRRASAGDPAMSFAEYETALQHLREWPLQISIRRRAEEIIGTSGRSPEAQIAFLEQDGGPMSGAGRIALADAWRARGNTSNAQVIVREAWRGNSLSRSLTSEVLARYGSGLTREDHEARADFLLWTGQRSAASDLKSKVSDGYRRLIDARIALQGGGRNVDGAINAVPGDLQNNPGLLYDRAKWRRKRGNQNGATSLLTGIDGAKVPEAGRDNLWDERNIALRMTLKDKDYRSAYALSATHGMSEGKDFAEAEWMAGWVALQLNGEADRGARHFEALEKGVSTPISNARAEYWAGRAYDKTGQTDLAVAAYKAAAQYNYTYYGQLAAERIGQRQISLSGEVNPTDAEIAAFDARPMVKALRLLAENGESGLFRQFAYHLDDELTTPVEYELLAQLASEYFYQDIGVRGAKAGLGKGVVSANAAYPIVSYPLLREPRVERPLMLALSRQESEMNPTARSHAGALGLMQFMPRTAQMEARQRGLPYRETWLTDDPGYNMTLGGAHLDTLLNQFNGSYIMTAAAYNAGASRPRQWIKDYGDPRLGEIDPIDWVEFIPFSETRNYVQRVLENTQVYRNRVTGQPADIRLNEDLQRGRFNGQ